jgi:predicted  nucleic acid-binding Zn-ribbon protein
MNADENKRLTKMEQSVEEIRTDISVIKSALIGNELTKDKGLIGVVTILQTEIDSLKDDIKSLQDERTRNSVYIKLLSYVTGALVTAFIAGFVKIVLF